MRVLHHAHCSVLVARLPGARGWVLAATDLSDPSFAAITAADAEARRRGAKLEVVHAVGFLDMQASNLVELGTPSIAPPPRVFEVAARELSACVSRLQIHAECKVLDRPAAAAIVSKARAIGAELVVVGARGRTGFDLCPSGTLRRRLHGRLRAPCSR